MGKVVKIYNINSASASKNFNRLNSESTIYWDIKSFENEEPDSEVFFIWREGGKILFSKLLKNKFDSVYDEKQNTTTFDDNGKILSVEGKWGNFVKFKVTDEAEIESNWDFTDRLGNQNPNYFLFKSYSKLNETDKRIQKIQDLKNLEFKKNETLERLNEIESFLGGNSVEIRKPKIIKEPTPIMMTPKALIQHAFEFILNSGFRYQYEEVANFYLALRTKPFVILAGISGTGKTQLPRKFAEALGFSKDQVRQIPVKPDWTDSSELIGYVSLNNVFVAKELTLAIQEAIKPENKNKPYFFVLDEMNLARVEHYFSDFLSVIETRKREGSIIKTDPILRKELLNEAKNKDDFGELGWPQNMFLIGTVNMDETTHTFSRKVLDRANSIEMNEVNLNWIQTSDKKVEALKNIDYSLFETPFIISKELSEQEKESISNEMGILIDVNKILQKADLHFAYRVRDEVSFYLIQNKKYDLINPISAFDFQLVQKVLPRIHGSSERIQKVLIELIYLLEKGKKEEIRTDLDFDKIEKIFPIETLKYKRASKKILFMLKRFDEDRFTSFWL
jgi:hypothetical protein